MSAVVKYVQINCRIHVRFKVILLLGTNNSSFVNKKWKKNARLVS